MAIYLVVRAPVLPEDEGRYHIMERFNQRDEATAWIEAQAGEYFGPRTYHIQEVE